MTFSAKRSVLAVSMISSYQLNFTYLGYACQSFFVTNSSIYSQVRYLTHSKHILISFSLLQETEPGYK